MTSVLRGKYVLGDELGSGGMAMVHAARNAHTEREVAIKRLLPACASNPGIVARFQREARAAGRIRSPHVVEVLDIDLDETGLPFMVMERLVGESLASRLKKGRLPPVEALDILAQILLGVGAAHAAGVVHRDLKPGNVFLVDEGGRRIAKILDFGISKLADEEGEGLTRTGDALGTFSHMSPEQIQRMSEVGPPADVWAVGVIAYRLLGGRLPFKGSEPLALVYDIVHRDPPPLASLNVDPAVAAAVAPVVERAMAKDVAARYPTADAMRADVLRARDALLGVPAGLEVPAGAGETVEPPTGSGTAASARLAAPPAKGSSSIVAMAAVGVVCLAIGGGVALWLSKGDRTPTPSASTTSAQAPSAPAASSAPPPPSSSHAPPPAASSAPEAAASSEPPRKPKRDEKTATTPTVEVAPRAAPTVVKTAPY